MDSNQVELWLGALHDVLVNGPEARFPAEPPVGSVLRYQRTYENRTEIGWHLTGRENDVLPWEVLVERIGDNECTMVVEYAEIPARKHNPLDDISNSRDWITAVFAARTGQNPSPPVQD